MYIYTHIHMYVVWLLEPSSTLALELVDPLGQTAEPAKPRHPELGCGGTPFGKSVYLLSLMVIQQEPGN